LLLQDAREVEDSARLRSVLGSGSSNGSSGSRPKYGRMPAHSRMLETWILCELCNVGNMQDAVMLREHSVFFEGDTPQLVRARIGRPESSGVLWCFLHGMKYVVKRLCDRCALSLVACLCYGIFWPNSTLKYL
jgi:hypothetical protein